MARTNYIFIDFENVYETDWDRIVGKPVVVTVVLGAQHKTMPVPIVKKLLKCAGQVHLIETKRTGKNSADFVLAQLIGEQKQSDPHGYFHIITKDRGFDATIEHLRENKVLAARRASFSEIPVLMTTAERIKSLITYFKDNPDNRPGRRKTLEAQIQAIFGKALTLEDVAATIDGLIASKTIKVSEKGIVEY
jgi:hypothetical protein